VDGQVEDRARAARRIGHAPALAASGPDEAAMERPYQQRRADRPGCQQRSHALEAVRGAEVVVHRERRARLAGRREHRIGVPQRERQGLLAQHVPSGAQARDRLLRVQLVRRAHVDGLHRVVVEHVGERGARARRARRRGELGRPAG
jgi:hypothetical protein